MSQADVSGIGREAAPSHHDKHEIREYQWYEKQAFALYVYQGDGVVTLGRAIATCERVKE